MVNKFIKNNTYEFIIEEFTENKIASRYAWLYNLMKDYLMAQHWEKRVCISEDILNHVIIDYFVDIYRLKQFQDIEKTHDSKIYAYTIYWLLRHKPMQLVETSDAEDIAFVNEMFATEVLRSYLFRQPENVSIANVKREDMNNFAETLFYYFKYRDYSAQSIEMIVLSFQAGRAYQYSADNEQ